MATRTFYATRDMKNPTGYGTRMLKAGDPVDLTGPQARLYKAIGAVSQTKPRAAPAPTPTEPPATAPAPAPAPSAAGPTATPPAAPKRAAPRKRRARAKR